MATSVQIESGWITENPSLSPVSQNDETAARLISATHTRPSRRCDALPFARSMITRPSTRALTAADRCSVSAGRSVDALPSPLHLCAARPAGEGPADQLGAEQRPPDRERLEGQACPVVPARLGQPFHRQAV